MKLSIRKFLLINLLLTITLTTAITAIGNYYLNQQGIQRNLDRLLIQAALSLKTLAGDDLESRDIATIQEKLNRIPQITSYYIQPKEFGDNIYHESYQFQIWNSQGQLLLRSASAPKESLASNKTGFSDRYVDGVAWRIFTERVANDKLVFVVGEHYTVRNYLAHRITEDNIYMLLLTYPLSGLLIWFIIGRGLNSINKVTNEVAQRAADHLEPVDLEAVPTEIKPLVDELNKLFLRLKQAFEREQRFAADAAHELRTPLAALRTQAQVALKTTDSQERRVHLNNVIVGVDRCTHVIQQLLTLCRVSPETATLEDPTDVDLLKVAQEVIGQLVPTAINKQIEIELVAKDPLYQLKGNATGLYALIRNLVDNAIRYTPNGGFVKVFMENVNKQIRLRVIDNGPGIPVELRSRVFERFYRVIGNTAQGSGLGLAIVQQIVKLHRGQVALGVPESGEGLEVEVILPKNKPNKSSQ